MFIFSSSFHVQLLLEVGALLINAVKDFFFSKEGRDGGFFERAQPR